MRRYFAAFAVGAIVLVSAACGGDDDTLDPEMVAACTAYNDLLNQRSKLYGDEMGAVGQAVAAGDEGRQDTSVAVIRELFMTTADGMREQAGKVSDEELSTALTEAADGLLDVANQIEDYEDVKSADELMADSEFADAGARVSEICAP